MKTPVVTTMTSQDYDCEVLEAVIRGATPYMEDVTHTIGYPMEEIRIKYDIVHVHVNDLEYLPVSMQESYEGGYSFNVTLEEVKKIDNTKTAIYSIEII